MMLVSACLAGFPCRYDGAAKPCEQVVELVRAGKAIPVCPEQLGGLGTPRPPCEILHGRVIDQSGGDWTDNYRRGGRSGAGPCEDLRSEAGAAPEQKPILRVRVDI